MTLPTFARAWILDAEGGYVDDPRDPGGETRWGISKRAYPMLDIAHLTPDDAARIYERDYWSRCGCDRYRDALALAVFDGAVNQGPRVAVRIFQLALDIHADGEPGPLTTEAAEKADDRETLLRYIERRWDRYRETNAAETFLRGWTRRLFRLEAACLGLIEK